MLWSKTAHPKTRPAPPPEDPPPNDQRHFIVVEVRGEHVTKSELEMVAGVIEAEVKFLHLPYIQAHTDITGVAHSLLCQVT